MIRDKVVEEDCVESNEARDEYYACFWIWALVSRGKISEFRLSHVLKVKGYLQYDDQNMSRLHKPLTYVFLQ